MKKDILTTVEKNRNESLKNINVAELSEAEQLKVSTGLQKLWAISSDEMERAKGGLDWSQIEVEEYKDIKAQLEENEIAHHTYEQKDELGTLQANYKSYITIDTDKNILIETKVKAVYSFGEDVRLFTVIKELVNKNGKCEIYGASATAIIDAYQLEELIPVMINESLGAVKLKGFLTDDGEMLDKLVYSIEDENKKSNSFEL